ncbi:MAG: alpha/beta hydrolase [Pseudomonadota bacterium]
MTRPFALPQFPSVDLANSEFARRVALAAQPEPEPAARPKVGRVFNELQWLLEPARRPFRTYDIAPAKRPQIVLIFPGFATRPKKLRHFSRLLETAGHKTKRWGLGFNWGADESALDKLEDRLGAIRERYDSNVVLLGWSLGGLYARELAKRQPDCVDKVITMGTPFSGSPRSNNAWRIYQAIAGYSVDEPPLEIDRRQKPPVETVAMWSPRDGVIAPRSAAGEPGERDRAIALRCTHMGFTYSPESVQALLAELDRHPR